LITFQATCAGYCRVALRLHLRDRSSLKKSPPDMGPLKLPVLAAPASTFPEGRAAQRMRAEGRVLHGRCLGDPQPAGIVRHHAVAMLLAGAGVQGGGWPPLPCAMRNMQKINGRNVR
jgi:hypothetical protein